MDSIAVSSNCPHRVWICRLLKDYLEQSKQELNYIEAKRAQDKLKELGDHELRRQCNRMEQKQREELV